MAGDAALFRLHAGLPRQAPGSDACTREALQRLPRLPSVPTVVDFGCGPGRSALVLAGTLRARVIALDLHQPFLDQLKEAADGRGLSRLIEARRGDMAAPGFAPGTLDLIWSEGAIYLLGFASGLRLWRPLLTPRGFIVVSECSWLSAERPAEAAAFWREAYPAMGGIADNVARARAEGFAVLGTLVLPEQAWWEEYYGPLLARVERLRSQADAPLRAAIRALLAEVDLFRRYRHAYGYVFYLMRRADQRVEPAAPPRPRTARARARVPAPDPAGTAV